MKKILRIVKKWFPELESKTHLPAFAVVVAVSDTPKEGNICDEYRPYYAVDVKLVDSHYRVIEDMPTLQSVPISLPFGGHENGFFAFPSVGSIVEIAYAYGMQTRPFVRGVLPFRNSLPNIKNNEILLQKDAENYLKIDKNDNCTVRASALDLEAAKIKIEVLENSLKAIEELKEIQGNSIEDIAGIKKIMANTIKNLSVGSISNSAGDNNNLVAGNNLTFVAGKNTNFNTVNELNITASKTWLGSKNINILQLLSEFMQATISALNTLASHTHPTPHGESSAPSQGGDVATQSGNISANKSSLDSIKK
ncbi:hypothetical protein AAEX28_13205 [Lentisphaerota bacterium WC36G]|nr:hypothetical protein LJT99_16035 [Lentisphaerae bacterium WC36]